MGAGKWEERAEKLWQEWEQGREEVRQLSRWAMRGLLAFLLLFSLGMLGFMIFMGYALLRAFLS